MSRDLRRILRRTLLLLAILVAAAPVVAGQEGDDRLRSLVPGAERLGPFEGDPPAAAALRGDELLGYVFSTRQVVNSTGFSGKPLDILVGLDLDGRITGAVVREQHEPILVIGVRPEDIDAFVARYVGRRIDEPITVTRGAGGEGRIDAISGATVSSLVINNAILTAARAVAASRGLLGAGRIDIAGFEPLSFAALLEDGSLVRRLWRVGEVEARLEARGATLFPPGEPEDPFLELVTGLATPARIGRNLLGDKRYEEAMAGLRLGDQLLFLAGSGRWSFKGTEWRRSGRFDRLRLVQGERSFTFEAADHRRIDGLAAAGAPEFRELALFVLRKERGFDPAAPWRLQVRADGRNEAGEEVPVLLELDYRLPDRYLLRRQTAALRPPWVEVWLTRKWDVAVLATVLVFLTGILFAQERIARSRRLHRRLRMAFLAFTLVWLGWYASAQLSVLNVLTFGDALRRGFRWDFFLLEPLIFVLWSYVAVVLLFWGRGVYCGWLCPFGALQELLGMIAQRLRIPQLDLPFALHERLRPIKFVIFLGLFAVALGSMDRAQLLAEVEPFKTAIVLKFLRDWPFALYALLLLAAGLFVQRFYCRYLCPLGAALAIPARLRQFEWLRRRRQCGAECRICAGTCPVQAIQPEGQIHPGECIYCLTCQVNYHDDRLCPPLIQRRQRRERREAMARAAAARAAAARAAGEAGAEGA